MKLSDQDRQRFLSWVKEYFKQANKATSSVLARALKADDPKLYRKIEKASSKMDAAAYMGRYLLSPISKGETWLRFKSGEGVKAIEGPLRSKTFIYDIVPSLF